MHYFILRSGEHEPFARPLKPNIDGTLQDKADSTSASCPVMVGDNRGWLYSLSHNDDPCDAVSSQPELNIGSSVCAWFAIGFWNASVISR